MPTRNISLTGHLDAFVETAVAGGRYQNASEVMREALRLLERRDEAEERRLSQLLASVDLAEAQLARGEGIEIPAEEIESFVAEIGREVRARRRSQR